MYEKHEHFRPKVDFKLVFQKHPKPNAIVSFALGLNGWILPGHELTRTSQNHVRKKNYIKSGKEKSQTINYRDKCAREWSQISFYTEIEETNGGKKLQPKQRTCNANSMQQGNGWASNNKTQQRTHNKKEIRRRRWRFQGSCAYTLFFSLHLWRMLIFGCIARRSNWMTRTTLALLFITTPSS